MKLAVSREAVVWAYRLVLQREPDNDDVITLWSNQVQNNSDLLWQFINSQECRDRNLVPTLNKFVYEEHVPIEVAAQDRDLETMLQRIAEAWSKFGQDDPFWSVITDSRFAAGEIQEHIATFYEGGNGVAHRVSATLARNGIDRAAIRRVLDFGCGVGRISFALSKGYEHVMGVDVSTGHLERAREQQRALGIANVSFGLLRQLDDINQLEPVDLIVSFIVLQHNPPPVAAAALRLLLRRLKSGGVAIFQMPTFIKGYQFSVSAYLSSEQPQMEINALPQRDIYRIIHEEGCLLLEVREDLSIADIPAVSQVFVAQRL